MGGFKYLLWVLVAFLFVLHQVHGWGDHGQLYFGFLPYSIVYHAGISIGAAAVWFLAVSYFWPEGLDDVSGPEDGTSAS